MQIPGAEGNSMETINSILSIIGLMSVVLAIVRIFWMIHSTDEQYLGHVTISVYDNEDDMLDKEDYYPLIKTVDDQSYTQCTLFKPIDVIVKKMTLAKIEFDDSYDIKKAKFQALEIIRDITPNKPLCIKLHRPEGVPQYALQWTSDYGAKVTYVFQSNGYNGKYNQDIVEYRMNIISKLRKLLDLK